MIIVMSRSAAVDLSRVMEKLEECGMDSHQIDAFGRTLIMVSNASHHCAPEQFERIIGVERVIPIQTAYKLASREFHPANTLVKVGSVVFGGSSIPVIAGPCAVENPDQLLAAAIAVKTAGAVMLRGGAFKPRSSPYSFQGLEYEGLKILREVSLAVGLPVVSEILDPRQLDSMVQYVDMLQIGARNMQNFALLKEAAHSHKPILLKRGIAATVEEWLMAAEYIIAAGNTQIVLCERGIRTFETSTRNTLDLNAVVVVKQMSHLPVIVDPSHGTGNWRYVVPMARAAAAAGADGVMVEVHPNPEDALSDGPQSLTPANFTQLMQELDRVVRALGRELAQGAFR